MGEDCRNVALDDAGIGLERSLLGTKVARKKRESAELASFFWNRTGRDFRLTELEKGGWFGTFFQFLVIFSESDVS